MKWWRARVREPNALQRERIGEALIASGAGAVVQDGDTVSTMFPDSVDPARTRRAVRRVSITAACAFDPARSVDARVPLHGTVGVHQAGRFVISPPWLVATGVPTGTAAADLLVIEPAMAFGTGEHPTTRTMLRLLQHAVRPGDLVADVGAGSGVLSIAAARLGAGRVAAIELDPEAAAEAEANVARNGVEDRVTVLCGDASVLLALVAPVRVVAANILSSVLLSLEASMRSALAPDGEAVLGGVLTSERDDLVRAFVDRGWTLVAEEAEEAWWSGRLAPC